MTIKMMLVVRTDLNMRKGKMCSQTSHASMAFITRRLDPASGISSAHNIYLSEVEQRWLDESFIKICVGVDSEEELLEIAEHAEEAGVVCHLIQDDGRTEFHGVKTYTCLALGPDFDERLDPITGLLGLL